MKYILLLPLLLSATLVKAQAPVKEYGIGFANFDQFSLQYRWGDGTKFYRLNGNVGGSFVANDKTTTTGTSTIVNITQTTPANVFVSAGFSVLKLKPVNEKIGLMYGINYSLSFNYNENKVTYEPASTGQENNTSNSSIQPSLGAVLGGYYKINDDFFLYAEIIPNLYYQYSKSVNSTNDPGYGESHRENFSSSFGISGLSNSGASLTLVYRITNVAK